MERRTHTLPLDSEERKKVPLYRGLFRYFPAALAAVARVSWVGNEKHSPGQPMHHARWKSTDEEDCQLRHLMDLADDFGAGTGRDENGIPQLAYDAWRALSALQKWLETHDGAPIAPGARLSPDHPLTPLPSEPRPPETRANDPGGSYVIVRQVGPNGGTVTRSPLQERVEALGLPPGSVVTGFDAGWGLFRPGVVDCGDCFPEDEPEDEQPARVRPLVQPGARNIIPPDPMDEG